MYGRRVMRDRSNPRSRRSAWGSGPVHWGVSCSPLASSASTDVRLPPCHRGGPARETAAAGGDATRDRRRDITPDPARDSHSPSTTGMPPLLRRCSAAGAPRPRRSKGRFRIVDESATAPGPERTGEHPRQARVERGQRAPLADADSVGRVRDPESRSERSRGRRAERQPLQSEVLEHARAPCVSPRRAEGARIHIRADRRCRSPRQGGFLRRRRRVAQSTGWSRAASPRRQSGDGRGRGAILRAASAPSMISVPEPHIGSQSGSVGTRPASASIAGRQGLPHRRPGASPAATRAGAAALGGIRGELHASGRPPGARAGAGPPLDPSPVAGETGRRQAAARASAIPLGGARCTRQAARWTRAPPAFREARPHRVARRRGGTRRRSRGRRPPRRAARRMDLAAPRQRLAPAPHAWRIDQPQQHPFREPQRRDSPPRAHPGAPRSLHATGDLPRTAERRGFERQHAPSPGDAWRNSRSTVPAWPMGSQTVMPDLNRAPVSASGRRPSRSSSPRSST